MSNIVFAKAFNTAFAYCEDGTFIRPVSLLIARTRTQFETGYDLARSFEDALAEIDPEAKATNPEKYQKVLKAARIGLGLEKAGVSYPEEFGELRSASRPAP